MRKHNTLAVLLVFAAVAAFGQTAKLTEPKAGASLALGTSGLISWNASGATWIKLVLFRSSAGKVGVIKANLALKAGSHSWQVGYLENGKVAPAGNDYLIHIVKMADDTVLDAGPIFSIIDPAKQAPIPILVMSPLLAVAKLINPAVPPPASATFSIKKITYDFESQGKLRFVDVLVSVNSPMDFVVSPAYGDPQYGAQWISYEIENPTYQPGSGIWITDTFSGTFSVKGGGNSQAFSHYPKDTLPAGNREYILSFKPVYNGLAKGCGAFQKMPSGPFEAGKLCRREFYPRMKIYFTAHTAGAAVKSSSTVYLVYDNNIWPLYWIGLPGETNLCSQGIQSW